MKKVTKTTIAAVFAATLAVSTTNLFAGGAGSHKHDEENVEYEHVMNEFGMYDPGMHATRTIEIDMSDEMRFTPGLINVKKGEVIKFKHKNTGQIMHEFVLGTPDSLNEHAEMMKKFPGMEHSEPYMIHVAPGDEGTMLWKFSEAGEFSFGCLVPGHYDAGMKGKVIVGS